MSDLTAARPAEHVLVEPLIEDAAVLAPFEAVLRRQPDGGMTLAGPGERWLPSLDAGRHVLIVSDEERGLDDAPIVTVIDAVPDAAGAVRVRVEGTRARRPTRHDDRVGAGVVSVVIHSGDVAVDGVLHDVSLQGLRMTHDGEPLDVGTDVTVAGLVTGVDDLVRQWQLVGEVMWAGLAPGGASIAGIRTRSEQRLAAARILRAAMREAGELVGGDGAAAGIEA